MLEQLAERLGANARIDVVVGDAGRARRRQGDPASPKCATASAAAKERSSAKAVAAAAASAVAPIGYVELRDGRARFHRVVDAGGARR